MNKNVELKYCNPPKASEYRPGRTDCEVLAEVFWKGELLLEITKWLDLDESDDRPIMIYTTWPLLATFVGDSGGYPDITPAAADALKAADEIEKFLHQKFCMPKVKRARAAAYLDQRLAAVMKAHPQIVEKEPFTDAQLKSMWVEAGGKFHGPIVETGTMPEERLLPFLRKLSELK